MVALALPPRLINMGDKQPQQQQIPNVPPHIMTTLESAAAAASNNNGSSGGSALNANLRDVNNAILVRAAVAATTGGSPVTSPSLVRTQLKNDSAAGLDSLGGGGGGGGGSGPADDAKHPPTATAGAGSGQKQKDYDNDNNKVAADLTVPGIRQDIAAVLRAKGVPDVNGGLGNAFATSSSAAAQALFPTGVTGVPIPGAASAGGSGGAAAAAAAAAAASANNLSTMFGVGQVTNNRLASLFLRQQLSRDATLVQLTAMGAGNSHNNNNNPLGNGMFSPSFLQAQLANMGAMGFGGGNGAGLFGGIVNSTSNGMGVLGGGKLDPRLLALAGGAGLSAAVSFGMMPPVKRKRGPIVMYMECDDDSLSEYQCILRKQIELFEADSTEAASSVQGRNKQIVEGQIGIRCRHCARVPSSKRQKGSMYFPTKLDRIYQAAQNLSAFHLCENCDQVPVDVRNKILLMRERKSPAGGGKRYWAEGVRCLGVVEDGTGLRFR